MASIDQFKAQLRGGGARANQFRVTVGLPAVATGLQGQTENSITIQYNYDESNSELREYRVSFDGDVYRLLFNDGQDPDYIRTDDELCF